MEKKIQYTEQFKEASKHFTLAGNKLLVERIDIGEVKTAGGIILTESSNMRPDLRLQKPHVGIVLACGQGYFDADTNTYTKLDAEVGNIVLLNSMGVHYYSTLPGAASYSSNKIGLTTENDVQMSFKDLEAFKSYVTVMGGLIEGL